ncbi:MAG: WXG100 family type VII secretion target [Micromonosporaceae bacterium]
MATQKVNGVDLKDLETRLLDKINSINGQVKALNANLDSLEGAWRGVGASEFNSAQQRVNNRMTSLNRLLAQYLEGIEATRTMSGNTEDDVAGAFRGVDAGVGGNDVGINASGAPVSKLNQF